jgi:hypothetical protein
MTTKGILDPIKTANYIDSQEKIAVKFKRAPEQLNEITMACFGGEQFRRDDLKDNECE